MYLVCLRAGAAWDQVTTIRHQAHDDYIKYFPLDEEKCPVTAMGWLELPNQTMYLIGDFEVRLISLSAPQSTVCYLASTSYFVNLIITGQERRGSLCLRLLRMCGEISQGSGQQKPTDRQRTRGGARPGLSWRQRQPAARYWQTSSGRVSSPCSWLTPCKTAL